LLNLFSCNLDWEVCFKHLLNGPISKVSKSSEGTDDSLQFAVLYHSIENDNILHYIRVYYLVTTTVSGITTTSSEYKDLLLPGNTMINAISLEQDSILFSR
jgi:hypothetical protein